MSWLSDIVDAVGGVVGYDDLGQQAADWIFPAVTGGAKAATGNDGIYEALITAGTGLAGIYAGQEAQTSQAQNLAANQEKLLAFEKEKFDAEMAFKEKALAKGGGGGGSAVAAARIAAEAQKKNTLANLYNNWAQNEARGGEALSQQASRAGENMTKGINLRIASVGGRR